MTVPPSLLDPLAEQSAVMAGLEKFTDYNITVLCFTDPGDGLRSQPVEVRTDEDGKLCYMAGYTNPRCQLTWAITFYMVATNIIGCLLWNLLNVTLLALRILKQILENMCTPALQLLWILVTRSSKYQGISIHTLESCVSSTP
jgi:hypothetical protein